MKCVWMALAAARLVFAADFALQEYLPPETKVVMGLRMRSLTESSLFQENSAAAKSMSENWVKAVAFAGFDPLHDIDEVILTSPADRESAPALLVLRGRFHFDAKGAQLYRGVAIHGDGKKGNSVIALLDENTAIAGELPLVKAAIDRRGGPVVFDRALVERVDSLRQRFDIWGTGDRPEGFAAPGGQNEQLSSIDRFEFGLRITHGLELAAEVHARSLKEAEKLATSLAFLQMMAKAQSNGSKFDVNLEESSLKLSISVSEEDLKKALAAQRASTQPKVTNQPAPAPPTPPKMMTTPGGTSVFTLPGK